MLSTLKERRDRKDEGFTLIELMVVVLIIAILLAIAIPTFLGARNQANSRAVQSTLRNALTAEQTYYTNSQSFGDINSSPTINSIEPNITWATAPATGHPNTVGVYLVQDGTSVATGSAGTPTGAADQVYLQAYGKDGLCYTVWQDNSSTATSAVATTAYSVAKSCSAPSGAATIAKGSAPTDGSGTGYYTSW